MGFHEYEDTISLSGTPLVTDTTPQFIGQVYYDTATGVHYIANGIVDSTNWTKILTESSSAGTGWRFITSYEVTDPAGENEISFIGLDLNAHELYIIVIEAHNSSGDDEWIQMYIGPDPTTGFDLVASNYYFKTGTAKGTVPNIMMSDDGDNNLGLIYLRRTAIDDTSMAVCSTQRRDVDIRNVGWWHDNPIDTDIERILFSSDDGLKLIFGEGTKITIYGAE
jgi:hypothetical protein